MNADALEKRLAQQDVSRQLFFVVDFQLCYKTEAQSVPAEVCIKPFNFINTPSDVAPFHAILSQRVPIPHILSAKHYTDTEHAIPSDLEPDTDYAVLWKRMNDYVRESTTRFKDTATPVFLCKPFHATLQCLEHITASAKQDLQRSAFRLLYPIDDLIAFINATQKITPNVNLIARFFQPLFLWDCSTDFCCEYHKDHGRREFRCSKTNTEYFCRSLCELARPLISTQQGHAF